MNRVICFLLLLSEKYFMSSQIINSLLQSHQNMLHLFTSILSYKYKKESAFPNAFNSVLSLNIYISLLLYYSSHHINFYRYLNLMIFYSFNLIFVFSFITNEIFKSSKFNYCIVFLSDSTEQHSTCGVTYVLQILDFVVAVR